MKKNFNVVILDDAKSDIRKAAKWYDKKQPALGKRFTLQIRKTVKMLEPNPFSSPVRYKSIRTAVTQIFPYMIHHTVDESLNLIIVVAVLHTSRNPDIWDVDESDNF